MVEKRGKEILIEGTDGSGKKTQSVKLVDRLDLEGFPSERMSFPRYHTPTGRIISQCYLGRKTEPEKGDVAWFGNADSVDPMIASLYYAADRKAAKEKMIGILNSGKNLVLDRYVESNMGHQGGKETDPKKREEMIEFIEELEYGLLKLPRPDLTIFLYLPYEHTVKLREKRLETDGHESNQGHLIRAEETYLQLAEKYKWTKINCTRLGNVRSKEDIAEEVYQHAIDTITYRKMFLQDYLLQIRTRIQNLINKNF